MGLTATLFVDQDADERRVAPRRLVEQETTLRQSGLPLDAVIHDLSSTGASVETAAPLAQGSVVTIGLAGVGRFQATVVSAAGPRFGCRFDKPLSTQALGSAFASNPLVTGSFGGAAAACPVPAAERKYPGVVRLALPIGGSILGWASILHLAAKLFG